MNPSATRGFRDPQGQGRVYCRECIISVYGPTFTGDHRDDQIPVSHPDEDTETVRVGITSEKHHRGGDTVKKRTRSSERSRRKL